MDVCYLFYLPFCQFFVSNDWVHKQSAPFFLRADQSFVAGGDLKAALMHRPGPELGMVKPHTLAEFHFDAPVDQAAFSEPGGLGAHSEPPFPANSTATISCVVMLRVTTSQAWHPAL